MKPHYTAYSKSITLLSLGLQEVERTIEEEEERGMELLEKEK